METIMTDLGRKKRYGPEFDEKIPYFEEFLNTYAKTTKQHVRNKLIYFYLWLEQNYENTNMLEVSYEQIKLFFEEDINLRLNKQGNEVQFDAKTIWYQQLKKYYSIVKEIFKSKGKEFNNPVPSLRLLNLTKPDISLKDIKERGKSKSLEYVHATKLLNYFYFNKFPYFIITGLLVFSGGRITEVMSIKQENLELGTTTIKVIHPKSDPRNPLEVIIRLRLFLNKIKGEKYGVYYFPESFLPHLKLYIEHTKLIYPESALLFPSLRLKNQHINPNTVRTKLRDACKLLGINLRITPHSFRSLLNKSRTRKGIDPDDRSVLLNHIIQRTESQFYNKDLEEFAKVQIIYDESFPFPKFIPDPTYLNK